jgi:hypothetical protein
VPSESGDPGATVAKFPLIPANSRGSPCKSTVLNETRELSTSLKIGTLEDLVIFKSPPSSINLKVIAIGIRSLLSSPRKRLFCAEFVAQRVSRTSRGYAQHVVSKRSAGTCYGFCVTFRLCYLPAARSVLLTCFIACSKASLPPPNQPSPPQETRGPSRSTRGTQGPRDLQVRRTRTRLAQHVSRPPYRRQLLPVLGRFENQGYSKRSGHHGRTLRSSRPNYRATRSLFMPPKTKRKTGTAPVGAVSRAFGERSALPKESAFPPRAPSG